MAVQALIANADGFFTLGYNYSLFLDPKTNRFVFIPGDQELSFANFAMMGSADQLMDMSLARPYGGENRLADRLLAIKEVREAHRKILKELATTVFRKERLLADVGGDRGRDEGDPRAARRRRGPSGRSRPSASAPRAARRPPTCGRSPRSGPPRSPISSPARRTATARSSTSGRRAGTRLAEAGRRQDDRRGRQGPARVQGHASSRPRRRWATRWPSSVAPDGAVYVAVDEQGSLGRTPGGGRVVRCVDDDGDGKADRVNVFAKMEHPRGVIAQDGKVWVLHPPLLSVFRDEDGDGTSDRQEVLVSGLTTSQIDERGGDHTTNGIRMGIDGWIYIAVGDYGFHGAKGKDGTHALAARRRHPPRAARRHGAGGLRDRPPQPVRHRDRPVPEPLHARQHQRRGRLGRAREPPDPDRRLRLHADGSPTSPTRSCRRSAPSARGAAPGALSLHDERWPEAYRGALLTGDWGRSEVYRHDLKPAGATLPRRIRTSSCRIPRPTGMDLGGDGRLYVASWRGGEASVYVGPQVGFLACVAPPGLDGDRRPRPEGGRPARTHRRARAARMRPRASTASARSSVAAGRPETTRALADLASDPCQAPARASRGPLRAQAARRHRVARRPAEARRRRRRPRVRPAGPDRPQVGARRRRVRARSSRRWPTPRRASGRRP